MKEISDKRAANKRSIINKGKKVEEPAEATPPATADTTAETPTATTQEA